MALNAFIERLEAERAKRDLTLRDFAREVLDVHPSLLSRYLAGLMRPGLKSLKRISQGLGVPLAELTALLPDEPPAGAELVPLRGEELRRVRALLAEIEAVRASGAALTTARTAGGWGHAPASTSQPPPGRRGVIVADDGLRAHGVPVGSVVWLDPATAAEPGKIVRVGDEEPPLLAAYEPGVTEPVTAVVWLVQSLR